MIVEGDGFKLYQVKIKLSGDNEGIRYFFSRKVPENGELVDEIPSGWEIYRPKHAGLAPVLKRK